MVMGSGTGGYYSRTILVGANPVQIRSADFNGDGHPDLAILSVGTGSAGSTGGTYGQKLTVLVGRGNGYFESPFTTVMGSTDTAARFAVADLNGNGKPDLALLAPGARHVRVALNTTQGTYTTFTEVPEVITVPEGAALIEAADVTQDGKDDLLVASVNLGAGRLTTFISDGAGGGVEGGSVPLPLSPTAMAVGFVNRDASPDVALAGLGAGSVGRVAVVLGNGAGGWSMPVSSDLSSVPSDVDIGDLNSDGTGDLLVVLPGENRLATVPVHDATPPVPRFVRGDVNGDGKPDISDAIAALTYLFAGASTDCLAAIDVNGDGVADIGDPIYLLGYLFGGGPPPPAPFPHAGPDPAPDGLGCERY